MSSLFARRVRVTQPPPICREQPAAGPFGQAWPPHRATIAASWHAPEGTAPPTVITSIQDALWNTFLQAYQTRFTVRGATLEANFQISNIPPWTAYIELIVFGHPGGIVTGEATVQPLEPSGPLQIHNPHLSPSYPGHDFFCALLAYPRSQA